MFVKDENTYYCREKVNGQTLLIRFYEESCNRNNYYFISFAISNKRKKNRDFLTSTGRSGLTGLLWAKTKIKEFETFITDLKGNDKKLCIALGWDDNRRRNVYARGLKSLGFYFTFLFGNKFLIKKLN